ncbi:MAG: hypothetical protein JO359_01750 [Candidatus Eremiobacteraeota bacterium]|nr:hypothetical protein [Candidatus Eremiobacteraeota bacterium]
MSRRLQIEQVADLRSTAPNHYEVSQKLPQGVTSLFGDAVPFGSPQYAAFDARSISARVNPPLQEIRGWRVTGSLWPTQRFILRIPKMWNGRLVVAGTPAQRSEFASDIVWSDPVLARGFAYICGNKSQGDSAVLLTGEERLQVGGVTMPRFYADDLSIAFWQHAPENTFERWMREFFELTETAREVIDELQGRPPELTYAVGLSNGGLQVRYALERSDAYAGGVSWNAPLWTVEHNLLRNLPEVVEACEYGIPDSLEALGIPPNVRGATGGSLYERNLATYWVITSWLYATMLDPEMSIPYGDVREPEPAESWNGRIGSWRFDRSPIIAERVAAYAHTGAIRGKLIDLASEYDHLIPPAIHFHPYGRMVSSAGKRELYRGEVIRHAQHVDAWSDDPNYPDMRPGYPRALNAFDDLVRWVEG